MSKRAEPPSDGNTSAPSSNTTVSSTVASSSSPPSSNTTVSSTAPSSSSPPTSATLDDIQPPATSSSNATASPPMPTRTSRPPPAITLDAIERARVTLQARAQAAAANEWSADDEDVVVALDVTAKDLDEVPSEWLGALKLELRSDGAAIITHAATNAHSGACGAVKQQVDAYARVNPGLKAVLLPSLPMGRGNAQPDVALFRFGGPPPADMTAIALFKIEEKPRTGPEMITTAAEYLTHLPTVECVISVKLFNRRFDHLPFPDPNDLCVPALALVFRRGNDDVEVRHGHFLRSVRVTQARSFGNVGVHGTFLRAFTGFTAHRLIEQPLSNIDHLMDPMPGFAGPLDEMNPRASVAHAMEIARLHGRQRLEQGEPVDDVEFRVPMPAPLAPIPVDLVHVFEELIWVGTLDPPPPPPPVRIRPNARANANADGANRPLDAAETAAPPVDVDLDAGDVLPVRGIAEQRVQDEGVVDDAALTAPWLLENPDEDIQFLLDMALAGDIDATATNAEGHDDADVGMGDP